MFTIGLTGGICSGKSTVGALFASHDIPIIDADAIAKSLCQPGQPSYEAIVDYFGPACIKEDQTLNRGHLAHCLFNDTNAKRWLESLLHPKIRKIMLQKIAQSNGAYTICMIPLLAETMPHPYLKHILVVDTDPKQQLQRLMQRDQLNRQEAKQRIAQQATRAQRLAIANDVIVNQGSITQLRRSIAKKHERYLSLSQHT